MEIGDHLVCEMSFEWHWSLYIAIKEPKMETSLERDAARRRTLGRLLRNFVSGRGRMEGCPPVPVWMWPLHLEGCVSTYFYCDRCGSTIIWVLGRPLWNKPIKNPLKTRPCHELAALRLGRRLIAPPARESGHQGGMQRSPWTGRGRRLHPAFALFYRIYNALLFARRCLNEARSCVPARRAADTARCCAALCAYAEQPCNHFCGHRQKWRQSGEGGSVMRNQRGTNSQSWFFISSTFSLDHLPWRRSNANMCKSTFIYILFLASACDRSIHFNVEKPKMKHSCTNVHHGTHNTRRSCWEVKLSFKLVQTQNCTVIPNRRRRYWIPTQKR